MVIGAHDVMFRIWIVISSPFLNIDVDQQGLGFFMARKILNQMILLDSVVNGRFCLSEQEAHLEGIALKFEAEY